MPDSYIPPPVYLQNKKTIEAIKGETNYVSIIKLTVTNQSTIIIPRNVIDRKFYTIYHDTGGEELLIDFLHAPTIEQYALSLPSRKLFIDDRWQGEVKAISRSGNPIIVHCREFKYVGGQ
ncbi:MAG: hypothetical protein AAGA60_32710 [Cyanobacteria bacterium P01_E01_bin.42]